LRVVGNLIIVWLGWDVVLRGNKPQVSPVVRLLPSRPSEDCKSVHSWLQRIPLVDVSARLVTIQCYREEKVKVGIEIFHVVLSLA